jgi:hypothetical protein
VLLLKLQDKLNAGDCMGGAKINRLGGTDKIHRLGWVACPVTGVFEVEARLYLLKQDPHRTKLSVLYSNANPSDKPVTALAGWGWFITVAVWRKGEPKATSILAAERRRNARTTVAV